MGKRSTLVRSDRELPSFESIYASEAKRLTAALALVSGSRQAAEDAVAEAFVRAYLRWPRVSAMESPTGWIYRVATNVLSRHWHRERLERLLLRRLPVPDPEVIVVDPDLWTAVGELPPRARLAVSLRYIGDLTEREVAEVLGVAPGTVAAALHQARRRLAEHVQSEAAEDKEGSSHVHR